MIGPALYPLGTRPLGRGPLGATAPPAPVVPFVVDLVAYLAAALPGLALYPAVLPQRGAPAVCATFQLIHSARPLRLAGASGVVADRYQFDCWGWDALAVATAAEGLRGALQGFRGLMGSARVRSCNLGPELTGWEPPIPGSAEGRHRHTLEFTVTRLERRG